MIDLYTYINEGLLQGMDRTLAGGEKTATHVLVTDWLKEQHANCWNTGILFLFFWHCTTLWR